MMELPKSLTAIVHVNFRYAEPGSEPVNEGEIELLSRILNQSSELPHEMQELMVKFADYLSNLKERAEPE